MNEDGTGAARMNERWLEADSKDFLEFGWAFVPDRQEQMETIAVLIPRQEPVVVMDLCAGEGLLSEEILRRCPAASVVAYDGSETMLASARARLERYGERFRSCHFDLAGRGWRGEISGANCIVSSLAVHHLTDREKLELFSDVRRRLIPGGRFIIADLVKPACDAARPLWAAAWNANVKMNSLRRFGDLRAWEAFRSLEWNYFADANPDQVDKPATLTAQLQWMVEAGFDGVDVHWMRAGHVIFSGDAPYLPKRA